MPGFNGEPAAASALCALPWSVCAAASVAAPIAANWIAASRAAVTPFSRGGDGRAAVGPMLREYVVSEAMHALGIPTTRSLAVVATGEPVVRDPVLADHDERDEEHQDRRRHVAECVEHRPG